jgi:hypothetical protein
MEIWEYEGLGGDINHFILEGKILEASDGQKLIKLHSKIAIYNLELLFRETKGNGWALFYSQAKGYINIKNRIKTNIPSLINSNSVVFEFDGPDKDNEEILLVLDKE